MWRQPKWGWWGSEGQWYTDPRRKVDRKVDRKVVREGGGGDFEVSVVKKNGNSRKDNRVTGERVRKENAINARGP